MLAMTYDFFSIIDEKIAHLAPARQFGLSFMYGAVLGLMVFALFYAIFNWT